MTAGFPRRALASTFALALIWATPATAGVPHTVQPGETLWSIAAASNFTTRALAAANGLPETAQVMVGGTVTIPSEAEAAAALGLGGGSGASATGVAGGSAASGGPGAGGSAASGSQAGPPPAGAYTVRPGDTLSGIAARSGVPAGQVAFMNGLAPDTHVITGTVLKLPTAAASQQGSAPPAPAAPRVVPQADPRPTGGRVTGAEIGRIASAHGVSPSLAAAVAWQESGFNNAVVSPANARGVMQILPGTWSWVEGNIARHRLDPNSPTENVHAGVMYLDRLVRDVGGDERRAVAGYYQGPSSVARNGMLADTERYVSNVMALRARFGG